MPKPFSTWWSDIALLNVLALALLALASGAVAVDTERMQDGLAAGQTAGTTIQEKYGNQASLRLNILNPMTSSAAPLETVDGSVVFTGQLSFPSSEKFLEVFMQPGPTGDLATVMVGADLDFDGTTDYSYQVPDPVSGVCGNGIIACTPGTWTDCRYDLWTADSTGRVSLREDSPDNLGGCYCINNDCGNDLVWNNTQPILQDLGGGVVGAMQQANAGFTVSSVKLDQTTIAYYGQDTSRETESDDSDDASDVTLAEQTAYLSNPFAITEQTRTTIAAQAVDPQSDYSLLSGFSTNQQQNTCRIRRKILLDKSILSDVIAPLGGAGSVSYCGEACLDVVLGKVGDNYWIGNCEIFEEDFRVFVKQPELIQQATMIRAKWDDYMQVWIGGNLVWNGPNGNFPPETEGACELGISWDQNPNLDVTSFFQQEGNIETRIRVSVSGRGEGYAFVRIRLKDDLCSITEEIVDECAELDAREDCALQEEEVDGVQTYRNSNPTGLTPLPSSETFTQGECTETLTKDWWLKERVYLCANSDYDFSDVKTRYGTVVESLGSAEINGSYLDQLQGEEGWVPGDGTIELMDLPEWDECETACKTRRLTQDTRAVLTNHSGQVKTDTDTYDILYHTCVNGQCPIEDDEEILKDCQCLNEFAEAASIMQMMRLAGQDTICSDGEAK